MLFYDIGLKSVDELKFIQMIRSNYVPDCIDYDQNPQLNHYRSNDECENVCIKRFVANASQCIIFFNAISVGKMFSEASDCSEKFCDFNHQVSGTNIDIEII